MVYVTNGTADVGARTDDHTSTSLYGKMELVEEHLHNVQMIYPSLAASVTVTGAAGAWALGAAAEVVPASTITSDFDIHWINISNVSSNDSYELHLFDDGVLAGSLVFTKTAGLDPVLAFPVTTTLFAANSAVTAKLASASGGAETVDIKVAYHTY